MEGPFRASRTEIKVKTTPRVTRVISDWTSLIGGVRWLDWLTMAFVQSLQKEYMWKKQWKKQWTRKKRERDWRETSPSSLEALDKLSWATRLHCLSNSAITAPSGRRNCLLGSRPTWNMRLKFISAQHRPVFLQAATDVYLPHQQSFIRSVKANRWYRTWIWQETCSTFIFVMP